MTAGGIVLALDLVAANGFFVAVEFGLARLRPTQAAEFARRRRPGAKSVLHAVGHIDSYLSACQLGITMCSLGLGALGEPAFHDLLEPLLGDAASVGGVGLESALAFGDLRAREVMKPRAEIAFVLTTDSPHRIAERVTETGHTRLPLCEPDGGLDV